MPGLRRLRDPRLGAGADARARRAAGEDGLHQRHRLRRPLRLLHGHLRDARHPRPRAGPGDRDRDRARGPLGLGRLRRRRLALDRRQPPDPRPAPQRADQAAALQQPDLRPDQGPVLADLGDRQDHQVDAVWLRGPPLQPAGAGARRRRLLRRPHDRRREEARPRRPCAPPPSTPARPSSRSTRTATSSTTAPSTRSAARPAAHNQIRLEHGQPIRFGDDLEKGVVRSAGGGLEVVDVAEAGERGLVVHDAHVEDPSHATALARLAESPTGPTPIGVFRDVKRPVYGSERQSDLEAAHAGATLADVDELLRSGDTWVV